MRVVSLGDSFSCGEGVGLRVELDRTWVGLLVAGLGGEVADWTPLAVAGARVRDVRHRQLAAALALRPELATVLVGLNDVVRAGFAADDVRADLTEVVHALRERGCTVLLVRLHDPSALLPLGPLRRGLSARVDVLHDAVDALADRPGVHVVDLGAVSRLADRDCWAVDRIHPSTVGHAVVAEAAAAVLERAGLRVRLPASTAPAPPPSAAAQVRWLVAHGLPWVAANLRSVALPLLSLASPASGGARTGQRLRQSATATRSASHWAVASRPASTSDCVRLKSRGPAGSSGRTPATQASATCGATSTRGSCSPAAVLAVFATARATVKARRTTSSAPRADSTGAT